MTRPRKRFGQNFLIDPSTIELLVQAIAPKNSDRMLEIGPGKAALTLPLLQYVNTLEVIEIDRDLIANLQTLQTQHPTLIIHQGDALQFNYSTAGPPKRVVGNLPYNISTPLIFHLLEHTKHIQDMHFMLQKEVIDRICAQVGERLTRSSLVSLKASGSASIK